MNQFKHLLRKMNVELTWVDPDDPDAWRAAVRPNTKAFFGETIGNPGGNVLDIETVAAIAHEHDLPLIVDNTFATPYLCRPIEWGADIVIHSATKFIGGHGTSIGGVVVEAGTFNWSNGRFPVVADPSPAYHGLQFHETFGTYGYLMKLRAETLRDLGGALSPFNAFLFLQGLETLSLRMDRHVANALAVAEFLEGHELATNVTYPGPAGQPVRAAGREVPAARGGRGVLLRLRRRARGRAGPDPRRDPVVPPGQRRRRQEPDHPPGQHHPPPAERRRARRRPASVRARCGCRSASSRSDDLIWDLEQGFAGVARMTDLARYQDPLVIQQVLYAAKTIAVVGLSKNELRASHFVGYYLKRHGYRVIPVNPREPEILGETSRPSLSAIGEPVDIVNVFRAPRPCRRSPRRRWRSALRRCGASSA